MKNAAAIVAALIVTAAIVVVGYQAGWWLREQQVNRSAEIDRGSFEYQETRRDEVVRQAETIDGLDTDLTNPDLTPEQRGAIEAQRTAAVRQVCNIAADLIGEPTPTVAQIIDQECNAS